MERRKLLRSLALLPLVGVATDAGAETTQQKEEWSPKKLAIKSEYSKVAAASPLSTCIRSGHLVYMCGIGGWYPALRAEPGDIKVQIHSALTIMKQTLETAGTSMANVLKVHMTLADPNKNLAPLNEVYRTFFPEPAPVRSFSGCSPDQMGRDGVLVQIDCTAYID